MLRRGFEKAREQYRRALENGSLVSLAPWRTFVAQLTKQIADRMDEGLESGQLRTDFASVFASGVSTHQVSAVVARSAFQTLMAHRAKDATHLARTFGAAIDRERRCAILRRDHGALILEIESRSKTAGFRRRRLVDNLCTERGIDPLPGKARRILGVGFVGILESLAVLRYDSSGVPSLSKEILDWFSEERRRVERNQMDFLPLLSPPIPWDRDGNGGFHFELLRKKKPIVFEHQFSTGSTDFIDALNALQSTAWEVDNRVLGVAQYCLKNDIDVDGIPCSGLEPPDFDLLQRDSQTYKAHWWRQCRRARSRVARRKRTIDVLQKLNSLKGVPFWHVWRCDYRGRMYPVAQNLSFHGDELTRGCLRLCDKRNIQDEESDFLFWCYGATLYGMGQKTLEERSQWAKKNEAMAISVALDPMGDNRSFWMNASKPWRFLAWCFAVKDIDDGERIGLPVVFDSTSSALQVISMLLHDTDLAKKCNVLESKEPSDIYQIVLDAALREMSQVDRELLDRVYGTLSRKCAKAIVMPYSMGAKFKSCFQSIRQYTDEEISKRISAPSSQIEIRAAERILAKSLWVATRETIPIVHDFRQWCGHTGERLKKRGEFVEWFLRDGFRIVWNPTHRRTMPIVTNTFGSKSPCVIVDDLFGQVDDGALYRGFGPHLIHSCDAFIARKQIIEARKAGATGSIVVHDCFGGHAADGHILFRAIRIAMMRLASAPYIHKIHSQLHWFVKGWIPEPPKINKPLPYELIERSKYAAT